MDRRAFLSALGTGLLAGCSDPPFPVPTETPTRTPTRTPGSGGDGSGRTGTPSPTPTETPTPEPASFDVEAATAPDEVPIGADYRFELAVRNTGERDGRFRARIERRIGSGSFEPTREIDIQVPAGGRRTFRGGPASFEYLNEVTYRVADRDVSWTVQVVPARRSIGEPFLTPGRFRLRVEDVDLRDSYTYEVGDDDRRKDAPPDQQWAFLWVRAENRNTEPASPPEPTLFTLRANDRTFERAVVRGDTLRYQTDEINGLDFHRGWIGFLVPDSLGPSDIDAVFRKEYEAGEAAVVWSA